MGRLFKRGIFLIANPLLVLPVVFVFHKQALELAAVSTERAPQSIAGEWADAERSGQSTLLQLSSSIDPGQRYSVIASIGAGRRLSRIQFAGLAGQERSWTLDELRAGVQIQSPPGIFAGPQGEFATIRALGFTAGKGGELELTFPGTLEQGVITHTRLQVSFDQGRWVGAPVKDQTLQAAWSEGLNNNSIVVN